MIYISLRPPPPYAAAPQSHAPIPKGEYRMAE